MTSDQNGPGDGRRGRRLPSLLTAGLLVAAVLWLSPARAQADEATARQLFREGRALLEAGKLDEACAKFAESLIAYASVGPLLNLGQCHEQQGKTATAFAEYNRAAAWAEQAGQAKRAKAAQEFATALAPKLSKLTIRAPSPPPGMKVLRDGAEVPPAVLGTAVALDPGKHSIQVTAAGYETWSTTVELGREADHQTVIVPALKKSGGAPDRVAPAPAGTPAAPPPSPEQAAPPQSQPPPMPDSTGEGATIAGIILAGTGVAAVAASLVMGAVVKAQYDDALQHCVGTLCTPEGAEQGAEARALGDGATVVFSIGAAVAVGGGLLWLLAPAPAAAEEEVGVRLRITAGHDGGELEARWSW